MANGKGSNDVSALRRVWGVILFPICLFVALGLFSYDWQDISSLRVDPRDPPCNLIGPVGAWMSFILFMTFGMGAYLTPFVCLGWGLYLLLSNEDRVWPRGVWCVVLVLAAVNLFQLHSGVWAGFCESLNIIDPGGVIGYVFTQTVLVRLLSPVGSGILLWTLFGVSLMMVAELHNIVKGYRIAKDAVIALLNKDATPQEAKIEEIEREQRAIAKRTKQVEKQSKEDAEPASAKEVRQEKVEKAEKSKAERIVMPDPVPVRKEEPKLTPKVEPKPEQKPASKPEPKPEPKPASKSQPLSDLLKEPPAKKVEAEQEPLKPAPAKKQKSAPEPVSVQASLPQASEYQLPPLSILDPTPPEDSRALKTDTATAGKVIIQTLSDFAIEAEVINSDEGPVVTRYELLPAPGVRVERIAGLSNNLAMALKATSVRVQAPIPGKGLVGIEVPNASAQKIFLRQMMEGDEWKSGKAKVPLALGKDVSGNDIVTDLASMPHLLVAGATGSGKTVCMNSVLAGLLMSRTPSELRLLLIDPKIVEFSVFNDIPHLVVPVVTNPKKVAIALRWAISEMDKRYKMFAKAGVRNIESFNTRQIAKQQDLFGGMPQEPAKDAVPDKVPYIVIVIDELADIMLVDQAEVEHCVARLAQLSRAVGIHMIISTQRPSVKVITGTIKANFPARIAFQLPQQVDSRTILDTVGAEKLLGKGDMLFLPPGTSKLLRAQGAMTKDDEMRRIVEFIKKQAAPVYEVEIAEKMEKTGPRPMDDSDEDEELVQQAIQVIKETQRASTSLLQRRLRIGYTRAARIVDILEERGIVGPPRGSDAREILLDLDGEAGAPPQQEEENPPPADETNTEV